jgi:hypothetical protein
MFSVWSRVASGSSTRVMPGALRPQSSTGERQPAALARGEAGAAGRQRIDHPAHRTAAQTGVAGHHREQVVARQHATQQPRRSAGVAHVEHVGRFHQPAHATTGDAPRPVRLMRHLGTERAHRGRRAQHVLALQQPGDARLAHRQRAEHQRTVADRLVARHGDAAGERRRGAA